jgi:hypothetical protein
MASVELVQTLGDCQGQFLHDRRGFAIIHCWREPREPSGEIADALQRIFHCAGVAECIVFQSLIHV